MQDAARLVGWWITVPPAAPAPTLGGRVREQPVGGTRPPTGEGVRPGGRTGHYRTPPAAPLRYRPIAPPARPAPASTAAPVLVATLLTPDERLRVTAAGVGAFLPHHCDTIETLLRDLRRVPAAAALVSARQLAHGGRAVGAQLRDVVRRFPRVPVIALVGDGEHAAPQLLLALGRAGVRLVVDTRTPGGWQELRQLLATDPTRQVGREALAQLAEALPGAGEGCTAFFTALFDVPPEPTTVQALARRLGVRPTTLTSRFARAGLPSPKRYLAYARLARAARLLENPGCTLAAAADLLDYSSAQSFGRHLRTVLGVSAAEFRRSHDAARMLARFQAELVLPHQETLRAFSPLRAE